MKYGIKTNVNRTWMVQEQRELELDPSLTMKIENSR